MAVKLSAAPAGVKPSSPARPTQPRPPDRRSRGQDRPGAWPYLLILPGFAFYTAFVLFPIGETIRLSFLNWNGLSAPTFAGWSNYARALKDPATWQSGTVSLVFIVFSCVLPVLTALLLAGIIARIKVRGLSFLRFIFFLPY
ncbi:MAG: hypothetical protein LBH68_00080, partial [Bifidobacteriaceae bacterium]|nr:hypothetical protein [Bifidobacteriaceae bacterium]